MKAKEELLLARKKGAKEAYRQVIINLHREGMNAPFIGAIVGMSRVEVKAILAQAGLE